MLGDPLQTLARRGGNTVCQDRRNRPYCLGVDVVPDGQDDLGATGLAGDQAVQFILRPLFFEEMWAEDDDAEPGSTQAAIDGLTQAVANLQLIFIEPY